jgi:hypothetical protein
LSSSLHEGTTEVIALQRPGLGRTRRNLTQVHKRKELHFSSKLRNRLSAANRFRDVA